MLTSAPPLALGTTALKVHVLNLSTKHQLNHSAQIGTRLASSLIMYYCQWMTCGVIEAAVPGDGICAPA